jgi:acyl-CoA thioester hydrolase
MDAVGHVNNAKYITYLECARVNFFEQMGLERVVLGNGCGFSLASVTCHFRRQVHYPAQLDIGTVVTRIGNSSFHLHHGIFFADSEEIAADGSSVVVWFSYTEGKSCPLPDRLRDVLEQYSVSS